MIEFNIDEVVSCSIQITMDEELTPEMYEEMFDPDAIPYNVAKSILANPGDEAIGIGQLSEGFREQIKYQIINNSFFEGAIYGDNVEFFYEMQADLPNDLTLEDMEGLYGLERMVDFLCEIDRTSGLCQINEYFTCEFNECDVDVSISGEDEYEVYGSITINNSDAHIVDHVIEFNYDRETGEFSFEPDNDAWQYFDDIQSEVVEYLQGEIDLEIDEVSHDEER